MRRGQNALVRFRERRYKAMTERRSISTVKGPKGGTRGVGACGTISEGAVVVTDTVNGMGDPFAVDLNAIGSPKIHHPKFTILFMDHGVTPGDLGRLQDDRIACGAAKGAMPAH